MMLVGGWSSEFGRPPRSPEPPADHQVRICPLLRLNAPGVQNIAVLSASRVAL